MTLVAFIANNMNPDPTMHDNCHLLMTLVAYSANKIDLQPQQLSVWSSADDFRNSLFLQTVRTQIFAVWLIRVQTVATMQKTVL